MVISSNKVHNFDQLKKMAPAWCLFIYQEVNTVLFAGCHSVLCIRQAIVIGLTLPGTGVIAFIAHCFFKGDITNQTCLSFFFARNPIYSHIYDGCTLLIQSPLIIRGCPIAAIRISASLYSWEIVATGNAQSLSVQLIRVIAAPSAFSPQY